MKFIFFSVSENGENGLSDKGVDGSMPPLRIFGLEQPQEKCQEVQTDLWVNLSSLLFRFLSLYTLASVETVASFFSVLDFAPTRH